MGLLGGALRLGRAAAVIALRPASGAVSGGRRLERAARTTAGRHLHDATLWTVDVALASSLAEAAVDRAIESRLASHAVGRALDGPLVDVLARDLARYAVVERITERLLADGAAEHVLDRLLEGPELERAVASVLNSPGVARVVEQTIESRLIDLAVVRMLDSKELWLIVDEIAQSPTVTDAIAQQGIGFVDQVADGVRARSRTADAWLESTARRALRRRPR